MLIRFLDCFDEQKIYKEPISADNVKLFLERYGRNDFQALGSPMEVQHSLGYLMKYIEKSGERLIYGGDLPTYFVSDVMDEDVICPYGIDDRKAICEYNFLQFRAKLCWGFCRAVLLFFCNFSLLHSIFVDKRVLLW